MQSEQVLSYHNDPALKSRFTAHVERHRQEDMVFQGTYGDVVDGSWRGCAVACSLRSLDEIEGRPLQRDNRSHVDLAKRLGIPLQLAYLEDKIFEGLPRKEALSWPTRFAQAIPVGADMSLVWPRFALWLLVDPDAGVLRFARTVPVQRAISGVAALFARQIAGEMVTLQEWRTARSDAAAAAYAAADAAYAAYADADAAAAAYAAAYADAAAYAAADAAAAAAAAAARTTHYKLMAAKLLQLMSAA